jgi:hypothetical protein
VHDCQLDTLRPKIAVAEAEVFGRDKLIRWQAVNSISNLVEILLHFQVDLFDANLLSCGWMEAAMRLTVRPEGLMERIALLFNLAPLPLVDTQIAFSNARAIMAAASLGVFEQLGQGDKTVDEIAAACKTNPEATKHLLNCLVGVGYARCFNGKYGMQRAHRKWLLRSSPSSLVDKLIFQLHEWDLMGNLEDFVRTGKSVDFSQLDVAGAVGGLPGRNARCRGWSCGRVGQKTACPRRSVPLVGHWRFPWPLFD